MSLVAGHKGQPEGKQKTTQPSPKRREGTRYKSHGKTACVWHDSTVWTSRHRLLDNVQQATIKRLILTTIAQGTQIYTDEYNIYNCLQECDFQHKTVNHSASEYARDENRDGFCEIHSNTIEGSWSLLRSWLRPHRGISQDKLPLYLSFFEFVHNVKKHRKRLLAALFQA